MGNALSRSRKKVDAEIMYEMRRQDMTNKQIAESLGCSISTVYNLIGRKSEAVKHAEVQHKPPVVDKRAEAAAEAPVSSQKPAFRPCSVRTAEENKDQKQKPLLAVLSAKYTMQGELCQYVIDTNAGTVEMPEGSSMVTGVLDRDTIKRFIDELMQVDEMLKSGRVSA